MSSMVIDSKNFGNSEGHHLNWYVHRDKATRKTLSKLWRNGVGIKNKTTMKDASNEQKIVRAVNILFRNMELYGPKRSEFKNYDHDSKSDLYHAHVWEARITYVVLWEADNDEKIINIVRMGKHENFNFKRHKQHKKSDAIQKIKSLRSKDRKYKEYLRYDKKRRYLESRQRIK